VVSVAYLAGTIQLRGDTISIRPRLQALITPNGTTRTPVVRIESDHRRHPVLSAPQRQQTVDAIVHLTHPEISPELQLDFDAQISERTFYHELLAELHKRLPQAHLSITALASWCYGDDWLEDLPVDEAVPMLFRMGADGASVRQLLATGADFRSARCRQSIGLAVDEAVPVIPRGRRLYLFAPRSWSPDTYRTALSIAKRSAQ